MIFVTVGTHEQGFNRLLQEVDKLAPKYGPVFMQVGFSTYKPKNSEYSKLISPDKMEKYMEEADLVITHGGPSTYMASLSRRKPTIVVPRLKEHNEHVNDHQLEFVLKINEQSDYNITVVTDVTTLEDAIKSKLQEDTATEIKSNTHKFNTQLQEVLERLL